MLASVLHAVGEKILGSQLLPRELPVLWHAGEPLTLPPDYYRGAIDILESYLPRHLRLSYCFQTNATRISEEWCRLFGERNIEIGVSLDGPKEIHDKNRQTRRLGGTFDRVMEGLSLLNEYGIPFHVITVLTRASLHRPTDLFEFFESQNIKRIHFNIEEVEGVHSHSSALVREAEGDFRNFLATYLRLIISRRSRQSVREIHDTLRLLCSDSLTVSNQLVDIPACVSVAWNGDLSFFSPELLGMRHEKYGDFIIGNILASSFTDIIELAKSSKVMKDIADGVSACAKTCGYFSVCGGGSPSNKLWENGTFASTETLHCRFTTKTLIDLALEHLETSGNQKTQ